MYNPPSVTTYRGEELAEWIGPAETQYGPPPCDCRINQVSMPASFDPNKEVPTLTVSFSGCEDFTVNATLLDVDAGPILSDQLVGRVSNGTWTVVDPFPGFPYDRGVTYRIQVTFIESEDCDSTLPSNTFTVTGIL